MQHARTCQPRRARSSPPRGRSGTRPRVPSRSPCGPSRSTRTSRSSGRTTSGRGSCGTQASGAGLGDADPRAARTRDARSGVDAWRSRASGTLAHDRQSRPRRVVPEALDTVEAVRQSDVWQQALRGRGVPRRGARLASAPRPRRAARSSSSDESTLCSDGGRLAHRGLQDRPGRARRRGSAARTVRRAARRVYATAWTAVTSAPRVRAGVLAVREGATVAVAAAPSEWTRSGAAAILRASHGRRHRAPRAVRRSLAARQLSPPLKWAGGKRWQVPHLRPLWKPHARRRLVEPFCGGLAVALGLRPDACAAERRQPAPDQLLPLAEARAADRRRHAQRRGAVLRAPARVQRAGRATGTSARDEAASPLLLPEPHRLQRPVPVQPARRVQRAVRPLRAHRLPARVRRLPRGASPTGHFVVARLRRSCRSSPTISSTRIRPTTWSSRSTRRAASAGTTRCEPPSGSRDIPAPSILVEPGHRRASSASTAPRLQRQLLEAPRRISCTGDRTPAREVLCRHVHLSGQREVAGSRWRSSVAAARRSLSR